MRQKKMKFLGITPNNRYICQKVDTPLFSRCYNLSNRCYGRRKNNYLEKPGEIVKNHFSNEGIRSTNLLYFSIDSLHTVTPV